LLLQLLVAKLDDGRHAKGHAGSQAARGSRKPTAGHLIGIDGAVDVIKVLDLEPAQQLVDAQLLQPRDGQRRGQGRDEHVGLGEVAEDVLGHRLVALPLHRVLVQVLVDEWPDVSLPFPVRLVVDWVGEAQEP
jgi:hypothetical protein